MLKRVGMDMSSYSGHSFRFDEVIWAFESGVPAELIKLQGDWLSDVYLGYVRLPLMTRMQAA